MYAGTIAWTGIDGRYHDTSAGYGVFKSSDRGVSWSPVGSGLGGWTGNYSDHFVAMVAGVDVSPQRLYAVTSGPGVFTIQLEPSAPARPGSPGIGTGGGCAVVPIQPIHLHWGLALLILPALLLWWRRRK